MRCRSDDCNCFPMVVWLSNLRITSRYQRSTLLSPTSLLLPFLAIFMMLSHGSFPCFTGTARLTSYTSIPMSTKTSLRYTLDYILLSLKDIFRLPYPTLSRPNRASGRRANRPGRFNGRLDKGIGQRPVWLSALPANRPSDTRTGRPICWQDRQPNRPLSGPHPNISDTIKIAENGEGSYAAMANT